MAASTSLCSWPISHCYGVQGAVPACDERGGQPLPARFQRAERCSPLEFSVSAPVLPSFRRFTVLAAPSSTLFSTGKKAPLPPAAQREHQTLLLFYSKQLLDQYHDNITTRPGSTQMMADPFEVRMRFSSQLQHLNASVASAQKAAQYALKYREWHEDLHSCILEQVERTNMNTRANIMYFIEHFLDQASREGQPDYIRMMQRDIIRVVDAVAPDDGSGAANVKVVRKVLQALQGKGFLDEQVAAQIEDVIKERGTKDHDLGLSSPVESAQMAEQIPAQSQGQPTKRAAPTRLDKRQIEQRIEEDRERHKRERESIWAIPKGDGAEMNKLWDETSDFGEDDDRLITEEGADFDTEMEMQLCQHQRAANGEHR